MLNPLPVTRMEPLFTVTRMERLLLARYINYTHFYDILIISPLSTSRVTKETGFPQLRNITYLLERYAQYNIKDNVPSSFVVNFRK